MSPQASKAPAEGSLLATLIARNFGKLEDFQEVFNKAALSRFGSGWAWAYCDAEGRLLVSSTPNQDPLGLGTGKLVEPVLGLDVWEVSFPLLFSVAFSFLLLRSCSPFMGYLVIFLLYSLLLSFLLVL